MNYRTETIAHELLDFLGIKRGQYIVPELPVGTGTENSLGGCNIYDKDFRFDEEYAYADVVKKDLPKPPVGGARGKKVVIIRNVDHPYHDPFHKMALKCGEFYGMYVCALSGSGSGDKQTAAVKAAIGMKPDLILYMPVDKEKSTEHMKLMYTAGIPVFGTNVQSTKEGMAMQICHTGPDEWSMARALAREVAYAMGKKGGLCFVTHFPGGPAYNARTYGFVSELKLVAPEIKILDKDTGGFGSEEVERIATNWIKKWGENINAIVTSESFGPATGVAAAAEKAGRRDMVLAGMDNNSVSMKLINEGIYHCCTLQSSALDGVLAMWNAARWFNGETIPPVSFIPSDIITKHNINKYMPPEW